MAQGKPGAPAPFFSMGLPTPQPMVTRPLLGIDWMDSPLNLKPGALLDAQGVSVRPRGLYRLPHYTSSVGGAAWSPADNPLLLSGAWGQYGFQYPYLFTENYIFLITAGYSQQFWNYAVGTVSAPGGGNTVTGVGTFWKTFGIKAGDVITIAAVPYTITAVSSDTVLTTATNVPLTSGAAYNIVRGMNAGQPYMVDACQATDPTTTPPTQYLVVATYGNQLMAINPTTGAITNLTQSAAKQPTSGGFTAECCAYFVGRIWAGHLNDGSNGELRQFVRWSKATDITDFSDATAYNNLLAQGSAFSGAVRRMVPMGANLLFYLDDALIVGSPSNTLNLPLAFQQIPSGGIGVAGPRAIASVVLPREETNLWGLNIAGHFFVGQDNIYFLSASSLTLQPVGSKIVKNSILKCQVPERIQAAVDWTGRRVRFGFPRSNNYIENIYDFNWETKEWSYEPKKTWMLGDPFLSYSLNVALMTTVPGAFMCLVDGVTNMVSGWTDQATTARAIYIENAGTLWTYAQGGDLTTNPDGSTNALSIDTQDYDEGAPGMVKFWRLLRLKFDEDTLPSVNVVFAISISLDMGRTWRSIGNLTVLQGESEGWINFRATGPHIRFRIASATAVTTYYIVELSRLVSLRGVQVSARQQHALP